MIGLLFVLALFVIAVGFSRLSARIQKLEERLGEGGVVAPKPVAPMSTPAPEPQTALASTPAPVAKKRASSGDLETRLGGKMFTAVGGIAVLFGVGFFLRYAFENNLITPPMRLALGFGFGLVCLGLGEWLRRTYAAYGQTLMGLGLGVFYLTWYASLHLYHLVGEPGVFIGMVAVTAAGLALALRLNSEPLGLFAQVGGLLTPILVGGNENRPYVLFPYLLLLDAAVLVPAFYKAWRGATLVGIVGTAVVFASWFAEFYTPDQWVMVQAFATCFFLVFVTAGLARYVLRRTQQDEYDLAVTGLNPFLYAIATYLVVPADYSTKVGWWYAFLGVLYTGMAYLIRGTEERDRRYRSFLAVVGSGLLAVAVPVAFDGLMVPAVWAVLAAALTAWSYTLDSRPLRAAAQAMGSLAFLGAVFVLYDKPFVPPAFLNRRFLTIAFVSLCLAVAAFIHWKKAASSSADSRAVTGGSNAELARMALSLDLLKVHVLLCFTFFQETPHFTDEVWIVAIVGVLSLFSGWAGCVLRAPALRVTAYITYLFLAFHLVSTYEGLSLGDMPVLNPRMIAGFILIASAAVLGDLVRRVYANTVSDFERRNAHPVFFTGVHLTGLWLASSELTSWFNLRIREEYGMDARSTLRAAKNSFLSVVWTVYALALLVFGIIRKSVVARQFAIVLFGVTVIKAFLYDTSGLSNYYRFISFMTLGVLLLLSGYLYNRFKDRIRKFVTEGGAS
jgi:uncharacterized membrane protein